MRKIIKYVGIAILAIAVMLSLGFNAASFYKSYVNVLRAEGYSQAMQAIEFNLDQFGKLELSKPKPDGTVEKIILVPEEIFSLSKENK